MPLGGRFLRRAWSLSPNGDDRLPSPRPVILRVTFNLVDFYHKEACLLGVDTLKLSPGEAAEILKALLPGFKEGIFFSPSRGAGFSR